MHEISYLLKLLIFFLNFNLAKGSFSPLSPPPWLRPCTEVYLENQINF